MTGAVRRGGAVTPARPGLRALGDMVPIDGHALLPTNLYPTNGVDTAVMARMQVAVPKSVSLFAPVWTGRGLLQTSDSTGGSIVSEADCPAAVAVSAAVETVDGRLFPLTLGGARRWSVPVGAPVVRQDPAAIDVSAADAYFWLRVFALLPAAGRVLWRNRYALASGGQSVVRYAIDPAAPSYKSQVLALSPSVYWPLDALDGVTDQSGNGRHGTAYGGGAAPTASLGPTVGAGLGIFPGGATEFDGVDDRVASTWKPFTPGGQFSWCGWVYLDGVKTHTLFGGGPDANAATSFPTLRVNTDYSLTFVPRFGVGGATQYQWTPTGLAAGAWNFIAFSFDGAADTAQAWVNGAPLTAKTGVTDDFAATLTGEYEIGTYTYSGNALDGRMSHVAAWSGHYLTNGEVSGAYAAAIPASADQSQAVGPLLSFGSSFAGADSCYFPAVLLGSFRG